MIEPSVCGGDAALCQVTLTLLYVMSTEVDDDDGDIDAICTSKSLVYTQTHIGNTCFVWGKNFAKGQEPEFNNFVRYYMFVC